MSSFQLIQVHVSFFLTLFDPLINFHIVGYFIPNSNNCNLRFAALTYGCLLRRRTGSAANRTGGETDRRRNGPVAKRAGGEPVSGEPGRRRTSGGEPGGGEPVAANSPIPNSGTPFSISVISGPGRLKFYGGIFWF